MHAVTTSAFRCCRLENLEHLYAREIGPHEEVLCSTPLPMHSIRDRVTHLIQEAYDQAGYVIHSVKHHPINEPSFATQESLEAQTRVCQQYFLASIALLKKVNKFVEIASRRIVSLQGRNALKSPPISSEKMPLSFRYALELGKACLLRDKALALHSVFSGFVRDFRNRMRLMEAIAVNQGVWIDTRKHLNVGSSPVRQTPLSKTRVV